MDTSNPSSKIVGIPIVPLIKHYFLPLTSTSFSGFFFLLVCSLLFCCACSHKLLKAIYCHHHIGHEQSMYPSGTKNPYTICGSNAYGETEKKEKKNKRTNCTYFIRYSFIVQILNKKADFAHSHR